MSDKLKQFAEKVHDATDVALVDSLIEHAQKMKGDTDYYEAVKIVKTELLKRLRGEK
jgi:hypothetical protein